MVCWNENRSRRWGGIVTYEMRYSNNFSKQLKLIIKGSHPELKIKIKKVLRELSSEPHKKRSGFDIKLISSRKEGIYRLRLGELRIIYEVDEDDKIIWVTGIFHRGKGYHRN